MKTSSSTLFTAALAPLGAGAVAVTVTQAAAPPEAEVQGLYEGTGQDATGQFKLEARVVAQGKGTFKVLVRQLLGADKVARVELAGKTVDDTVTFAGKAGAAEWKG